MLAVGLVWAGVPASTVLLAALVLACPLMMLFMHGGGHDHGTRQDSHEDGHDRAGLDLTTGADRPESRR